MATTMQRHVVVTLIVILVALTCNNSVTALPGLCSVVTQKGLDYVRTVGLAIILPQIQSIGIPDLHTSTSISVIGNVSIDVTSIHLNSLNVPIPSTAAVMEGDGIHATITNVDALLTANWHYREDNWPHISDSGGISMHASGVSVTIIGSPAADGQGHVQINISSCSASIGGLDINFSGGTSWLYNLFKGPLSGTIKDAVSGQLCPAITDAIKTNANQALKTIPTEAQVDQWSELDYSLLENPVHGAAFVATPHRGEFYRRGNHTEFPGTPIDFGAPSLPSDKMLSLYISDYLVNTAFKVYYDAGELQTTITQDNVPSSLPFKLNTASFKDFAPNLYAKFPDMPMQIVLAGTSAPTMSSFSANGGEIDVIWIVDISIQVVTPTAGVQTAFVMASSVHGDGTVCFVNAAGSSSKVTGILKFLNATVSVSSSNIGDLDVVKLSELTNAVCEFGLIPIINKSLSPGFPLPLIDGVSLINSVSTTKDGFVQLDFDANYAPHIQSELRKQLRKRLETPTSV